MNNILIVLLSLDESSSSDSKKTLPPPSKKSSSKKIKKASTVEITSSTQGEITISTPPSFYKNTTFEKVFLIGRKAKSINSISNFPSLKDFVKVDVQPTKLFSQTPKVDQALVGDDYQAPYEKTVYKAIENFFRTESKDFVCYFACEKDSYFDQIPYSYQLASIVKPRSFPFYIKDKKITAFSDFEDQLYEEGKDVYTAYYTAGFHLLKNTECVPGWSISPNLPWISLIMSLYRVVKSTSDMMLYQEFLSIARLRATIFYLTFNELRKKKDIVKKIETVLTEEEENFALNYLDKRIFKEIFNKDLNEFSKIKTF